MKKPIRVLLVDDETSFTATLAKRLERRGLSVATAGDADEAFAALERSPRDVAVLDVKMPGPDGIQLLKAVRKSHPETEVIMLTGHADMDCALNALSHGAFDFLLKPINIELLECRIIAAARSHSLHSGTVDACADLSVSEESDDKA